MEHGNHRGFRHRGMAHQRALERDAADPLAAALAEIFRSILNRDRHVRVDRHDIARLEPPIVCKAIAELGLARPPRADARPTWDGTREAPRLPPPRDGPSTRTRARRC